MSLIEYTLDGKIDKVEQAIQRFKSFEPEEGYFLAFSGGKDSVVIKRLAEMAGVKFDAHYSVTSVDPPELVRFIKSMPDVQRDIPTYPDGRPITMWNLIPKKKMPPTRLVRYCCDKLKESAGVGRITVTGVRWDESVRRKNNRHLIHVDGANKTRRVFNFDDDEAKRTVEQCYRTRKTLLNPIIDWTDEDVWEFIKVENVPCCGLYDSGFSRLGCIGCPMNAKAEIELEMYPKYKEAYIRAFDRMLAAMRESGVNPKRTWNTGEEVMDWWLGKTPAPKELEGQLMMELEETDELDQR